MAFSFGHAAYAVLDEEAVGSLSAVEKGEVSVEEGGEKLSLNGGENGAGVFKNGRAGGKEKKLGVRGTNSC